MDSVDVMDRLAKLLNDCSEAGYSFWESEYFDTFYVEQLDGNAALAEVTKDDSGKWVGRVRE